MAAACLPRTPPVKSYSGRIVSCSAAWVAVAFFIRPPFAPRRQAAANEPDPSLPLCIADHQEPMTSGEPDGEIPLFALRVVGIGNGARERVHEHRRGLFKGDAMIPCVGLGCQA